MFLLALLTYAALLTVTVTAHEAGHAAALRALRQPAARVQIGFGPRLLRLGTWTWHALPLAGQAVPPATHAHSRVRARCGVYLAGPAANLLLGAALLSGYLHLNRPPAHVTVQSGSGALQTGDILLDGARPVPNTPAGSTRAGALLAQPTVTVQRNGRTMQVTPGTLTELSAPDDHRAARGAAFAAQVSVDTVQAAQVTAQGVLTGDAALIRTSGLGSPISAAQLVAQELRRPAGLLLILTVMNFSVAAFNLMPLPPLDGGQIALLIAERVRGRPLRRSRALLTAAGALMVLIITAGTFWADLS